MVVGVPDGKNLGHDGANDPFDFGEFLPLEGCENRYCGVVGGYVEDDARSVEGVLGFLTGGRGGRVRSW